MITEGLMRPGSFIIRLKSDTPYSVWSRLSGFSHIVVTAAPIQPIDSLADADILDLAIYTGVALKMTPPQRATIDNQSGVAAAIEGEGLAYWLGTDDGRGDLIDTAIENTATNLSGWLDDLLPSSIGKGSVTSPADTLTYSFQMTSRREAITYVCRALGCEWRVRPDGYLDAAVPATLFGSTPGTVITRHPQTGDSLYRGVEAVGFDSYRSVDGWTTKAIVVGKEGDGAAIVVESASGSAVFKDLFNNDVVMERFVNAPDADSASAATVAQAVIDTYNNLSVVGSLNRQIRLSSRSYAISRSVTPGDYVYVYDPLSGLQNSSQQIRWRGEVITPVTLRVTEIIWPVTAQMGVYARLSGTTATYVDLTPYIVTEDADTTWTVEAWPGIDAESDLYSPAFLGVNPDILARFAGAPSVAWTPTLIGSVTDPTLGSGSSAEAEYKIVRGMCHVSVSITFGTSGVSAGSGSYSITGLPIAPKSGRPTWLSGTARIKDSSTGNINTPHVIINDSGVISLRYPFAAPVGADTFVGASSPWTWNTSDRLEISACFPVN